MVKFANCSICGRGHLVHVVPHGVRPNVLVHQIRVEDWPALGHVDGAVQSGDQLAPGAGNSTWVLLGKLEFGGRNATEPNGTKCCFGDQ